MTWFGLVSGILMLAVLVMVITGFIGLVRRELVGWDWLRAVTAAVAAGLCASELCGDANEHAVWAAIGAGVLVFVLCMPVKKKETESGK